MAILRAAVGPNVGVTVGLELVGTTGVVGWRGWDSRGGKRPRVVDEGADLLQGVGRGVHAEIASTVWTRAECSSPTLKGKVSMGVDRVSTRGS